MHSLSKTLIKTRILSESLCSRRYVRGEKRKEQDAARAAVDLANRSTTTADGFRVLEIFKKSEEKQAKKKYERAAVIERSKKMTLDQDWTNVWPTNASFKQSAVPLPIHQGHVKNAAENGGIAPGKYANAELMKIPNFFHLTPPHIAKHCAAIKKFCTEWPKELKDDESIKKYFPVEIKTTDYIYASPSIRDERSRIVTLRIPISSLKLDQHAKEKLVRLAGDRLDKDGILTLQSDKCPYRKQNYDYVNYLLTALYYESWKVESWESSMTEDDLLAYDWQKSKSKNIIENFVQNIKDKKVEAPVVESYAKSLENVFNNGETQSNLNEYKQNVLKLLGLDASNKVDNNTQKEPNTV